MKLLKFIHNDLTLNRIDALKEDLKSARPEYLILALQALIEITEDYESSAIDNALDRLEESKMWLEIAFGEDV